MAILADEGIRLISRSTRSGQYQMPHEHFHNRHELYFLEKGKATYFLNNEIFLLEEGDMVFIHKGIFHKTGYTDEGTVERLLFSFDDNFVWEECLPFLEVLKKQKFIRLSPDGLYKLKEVFHKIEKENATPREGSDELMRLYFQEVLILICRYRLSEISAPPEGSMRLIGDAAKYISANCNADLRLETLSRKYAMSPSHFSRLFKNVTGIGLSEYINISRISAAEKLLLERQLPITEVALQCGFNDSNYFAAIFKKIKGITPKKFSIMHRDK